MNIFNIPSWYPSENNPIYGTFIKEQIEMLAQHNPDWNMCVSLWGQGDPDHMLWVSDHFKNVPKLLQARPKSNSRRRNIYTYSTPTPTWTRKLLNGNIKNLVEVNENHFNLFREDVGSVDVIHAQATFPASLIASALSQKFGIPYFVTIRMSPFPFDEFLTDEGEIKAFVRKPLEHANGLIATSSFLGNRLNDFGFDNVMVVNNPVDTDYFKPFNHQSEKTTILTVGRMVPQKGIDILIKAVKLLPDTFTGEFRIGGDHDYIEDYKELADSLGVAARITWLGELSRSQVREEMQRCSYYLLPSRHETFGNVLLEALACGKPVIATKCGGPLDIVSDEVGMLIDNENPEELAKALVKFNSEVYDSQIIRRYTEEKFSIGGFSESLRRIFTA